MTEKTKIYGIPYSSYEEEGVLEPELKELEEMQGEIYSQPYTTHEVPEIDYKSIERQKWKNALKKIGALVLSAGLGAGVTALYFENQIEDVANKAYTGGYISAEKKYVPIIKGMNSTINEYQKNLTALMQELEKQKILNANLEKNLTILEKNYNVLKVNLDNLLKSVNATSNEISRDYTTLEEIVGVVNWMIASAADEGFATVISLYNWNGTSVLTIDYFNGDPSKPQPGTWRVLNIANSDIATKMFESLKETLPEYKFNITKEELPNGGYVERLVLPEFTKGDYGYIKLAMFLGGYDNIQYDNATNKIIINDYNGPDFLGFIVYDGDKARELMIYYESEEDLKTIGDYLTVSRKLSEDINKLKELAQSK